MWFLKMLFYELNPRASFNGNFPQTKIPLPRPISLSSELYAMASTINWD